MADQAVLVDIDGHVATVTINRPDKLNAINKDVREQFVAALADLETNDEVRVAIVTGAGEKAFIAGADIAEFQGGSAYEGFRLGKSFGIFEAPERFNKPIK